MIFAVVMNIIKFCTLSSPIARFPVTPVLESLALDQCNPSSIAPLVIGVVIFSLFIIQKIKYATNPLLLGT